MAERVVISELDINAEAFIKKTTEIKKKLDELKNSQDTLKAAGKESSAQYTENAAVLKTLNASYSTHVKVLAESGKAVATQADRTNLLEMALNNEVTSIKEARDQNKLLNKLRNETNVTTKEGQAELKSLNAALDSNNDFIKENADSYLKQKINVGNYSDSIKDAFGQLNIFNGGLSQFKSVGQAATIGFNAIKDSANDVTNAFKEYKETQETAKQAQIGFTQAQAVANEATEKATKIGFEYGQGKASLTQLQAANTVATQANATATTAQAAAQSTATAATSAASIALRVFRVALISTGIGAIVVALGSLIAFLTSTQKGMDIVSKATAAVGAAFNVILDRVAKVGGALAKFFAGDFAGAYRDLTDAATGAGDELAREVGLAVQLEAELQKLKKQQIAVNVGRSEANKLIKEQNKLAEDTSKSTEERLEAINKAIELENKQLAIENKLANNQLKNDLQLKGSFEDNEDKINDIRQAFIDSQEDVEVFQEKLLSIGISETTVEDVEKIAAAIIANNAKIEASEEKQTTLGNKRNTLQREAEKAAADAQKAAIEAGKKATDERLKQQQDELNLFLAKNDQVKKTLDEQVEFEKKVEAKKLDILKANLEAKKISQTEYDIAIQELENEKINRDEELKNAELERLKSFEDKKKELLNELELAKIADEDKKRELQIQREFEEKTRQLENLQLNAEEKLELEKLLLEQRNIAINELDTAVKEKNLQKEIDMDKQRIASKEAAFNAISNLVGSETKLGQALLLAKQISAIKEQGVALGLFQTKASLKIAEATADAAAGTVKSAASAPFPANIPLIAGFVASIAGAIGTIKKAKSQKFEKGGIASIDGARHTQGGVPIYAGSKYIGEAEGGEGIGILNRGAYASFMDFNNSFGSGKSSAGFFEGGGIITRSVPTGQPNSADLIDIVRSMPNPIVTVEDIRRESSSFVQIESGANV